MPLITVPTGDFAAGPLAGHVFSLIAHSRIVYQIEHSGPVQAVMSTLLATLAVSAVNLLLNRQRLSWRVYSDEPLDPIPAQAQRIKRLVAFEIYLRDTSDPDNGAGIGRGRPVVKPGIVLIRVRNSGLATLKGKKHLTVPLTFRFPGRQVLGALVDDLERGYAEVLELPVRYDRPALTWPQRLRSQLSLRRESQAGGTAGTGGGAAVTAPDAAGSTANLPVDYVQLSKDTFRLKRKGRFTLMVVLSGTPARDQNAPGDPPRQKMPVEQKSDLLDGEIDEESPRGGPRTRSLIVAGLTGLLLTGLILGLLLSPPPPAAVTAIACHGGNLTLIGSTAFSPVARTIAGGYEKGCPAVRITVPASNSGSGIGLRDLLAAGTRGQAAGLIAMSDGPAPAADRGLAGSPVAIIIYTIIVNSAVPFNNLTASDIKDIFNGTSTSWNQIRGPDRLPGPDLPVKIISREPGSGSRNTFDQQVLALPAAAAAASCTSDASPQIANGIDCVTSTAGMLQAVSAVQGAIGYAQIGDVATYRSGGIQAVAIDGLDGRYGDIGRTPGTYAFWTVEYLYTYGPAAGLAKAFLKYLGTPTAVSDLEAAQYTPCPANGTGRPGMLCAQAGS
ncbi:MAG: substrate-binding domain-containing protein [Streptosporangiaceae bacterium]|jgi:ABC-type phosphate transport system substrate-binding protein